MKKSAVILGLVLGLTGNAVYAQNLDFVCEQDDRAADGSYSKVEVKYVAGDRADVYYSLISGGLAPAGANGHNFENKVIGENLLCIYDQQPEVTLSCHQQGRQQSVLDIRPTRFSGLTFIEAVQNGHVIALFEPSSCKPRP